MNLHSRNQKEKSFRRHKQGRGEEDGQSSVHQRGRKKGPTAKKLFLAGRGEGVQFKSPGILLRQVQYRKGPALATKILCKRKSKQFLIKSANEGEVTEEKRLEGGDCLKSREITAATDSWKPRNHEKREAQRCGIQSVTRESVMVASRC